MDRMQCSLHAIFTAGEDGKATVAKQQPASAKPAKHVQNGSGPVAKVSQGAQSTEHSIMHYFYCIVELQQAGREPTVPEQL